MSSNYIGCDFSLNKPTICLLSNGLYSFYSWPFNINPKSVQKIGESGVNIIERTETRPKDLSASDLVRYDITNSNNLANSIIDTLNPFINKNTKFIFEGSSFASRGNIALQLTAWRYILVYKLSLVMSLDNIFSYSPQTLKATAHCSKKGMGKSDMIKVFIEEGPEHEFRKHLIKGELFNKGGKKWIEIVDDVIDSYYAVRTYMKKEEFL